MEAVDDCFLVGHDNSGLWSGVIRECSQELFGRGMVWASSDFPNVCHGADRDEVLGIR